VHGACGSGLIEPLDQQPESLGRRLDIATSQDRLKLLDLGLHPALPGTIDRPTPVVLPNSLLGRQRMSHVKLLFK
jgi:hypothetical protein